MRSHFTRSVSRCIIYIAAISRDRRNCWARDKRSESALPTVSSFRGYAVRITRRRHLTHESCTRPCPRLGLPRNTARHLPTLADQLFAPSSSLADSRNSHDTLGRARAPLLFGQTPPIWIYHADESRANFAIFDRSIVESSRRNVGKNV